MRSKCRTMTHHPLILFRCLIILSRSPVYALQQASDDELRKTQLEWTRFANGFFLDYYGVPHVKTYLPTITFAVDIASKKAALPGTGNETIALTYSFDVAKFVSPFLNLPKWEEVTYCYGEKTTWNKFVKVAEEVTGMNPTSGCACEITFLTRVWL